uniref:Uncharacterized protein n=1 Tax=Kalmanozyma brasiliensis (strain GHG001) TaxID=1365824 RepID=V5EG11_KALBG
MVGAELRKAASPNKAFLSVLALLGLVLVYTSVGLWLFIKGFLLTRHELSGINECAETVERHWTLPGPPESFDDASLLNWAETVLDPRVGKGECRLAPTHKKAVVLIIDALRYDFVAPLPPTTEEDSTGWTPNPYYHNILSLPAELTAKHGSPAYATQKGPSSFLAHFAADPPTTTLQRLKGLTTGTLPTFIEAGANFGSAGTGIGQVNEDNWIAQFKRSILTSSSTQDRAGLVFAGDDTWSTVFPNLFDAETTWTYDSFNVEDLDTVDRGVESKLLLFLQQNHPDRQVGVHDSWRLLVGHTLGVDHVGHRFGASHSKMKVKLEEMQLLLKNITDAVDEETLVVVMGDHGMDERGDHGGDAELEIGAGLWMYSKGGFGSVGRRVEDRLDPAEYISTPEVEAILPSRIPFSPLPSPPYPSQGHRSVPQIDLVPTISILLGLPIPYNNLGSIIPDLFPHPDTRLLALRITATQMRSYLTAYSQKSPDLAAFKPEFDALWLDAVRADAELAQLLAKTPSAKNQVTIEAAWRKAAQAYHRFNRVSLVRAREVWAQFDMVRIAVGLVVLVLALTTAWVIRDGALNGLVAALPNTDTDAAGDNSKVEQVRPSQTTEELYTVVKRSISRPMLTGSVVGAVLHFATLLPLPLAVATLLKPLTLLDSVLAGASIASQLCLLIQHFPRSISHRKDDDEASTTPATTKLLASSGWLILLIHSAIFASNSFLVFEDRFVLLSLTTLLLIRGLLLLGASPNAHTKTRALMHTLLALGLTRVAAYPRVCREEQAPHCTSTFFASSPSNAASALNSPYTIALAYILAYLLPSFIARFLRGSKSFVGIAPAFFDWVVRPTLMSGAGYWALDWASVLPAVERSGWGATLEWVKGWVAVVDLVVLAGVAMAFWIFAPLCLDIRREPATQEEEKEKVRILGYANSFGSSFVLLVGLVVGVLWVVTQPSGQLALGCVWLCGMLTVELGDAERDVLVLHRQRLALASATSTTSIPDQGAQPSTTTASISTRIHLSSAEIATFALLGYLCFFGTGHQATFPSIQWRLAFLTSPTLAYPLSPLLVALNSFGHLTVLPPLFTVLALLWNTSPLPRGSGTRMTLPRKILAALLTLALYNGVLLLSTTALSGLVFRRHLMLFKVWTPRVMLASIASIGGQTAGMAVTLAAWQVANKVNAIFGSEFA